MYEASFVTRIQPFVQLVTMLTLISAAFRLSPSHSIPILRHWRVSARSGGSRQRYNKH